MKNNLSQKVVSKQIMQARMQLYKNIRTFFETRNVQEVETPILSAYGGTDVQIDSFVTHWQNGASDNSGNSSELYLHTSPEFAMKCLLTDGFGDCFQIAKVFRNESAGRNHRPEFSMLEWYRIGLSLTDLMAEVAELAKTLIPHLADLPVEIISYKEVLIVTQIERKLGSNKLTFLTHYPASMAALAKKTTDCDGNLVAERFELYYQGIELANGFNELTDADEQLARFKADNAERVKRGKPEVAIDYPFIEALQRGMPECSGVALGLDRVLMLAEGMSSLDEVSVFSAPIKYSEIP